MLEIKELGRWLVSLTPQLTWWKEKTGSCKSICKIFIFVLNETICFFFTLSYSLINLVFDDEEESKLTYTEIHQEYKELVSIFPTDFCSVLFEMGFSLYSLGWPGTHYVNHSGLDLLDIYVSLPPQCWD